MTILRLSVCAAIGLLANAIALGDNDDPSPGPLDEYAIGADLSFLDQAEANGPTFRVDGRPTPGLELFRDHGYNWIRLRLFNDPGRLPNDLPYTIGLAKRAKKLGYKFLLDFHYSDTWADPGKQFLPKVWKGKSHVELVKAVRDYSRETIAAFRRAGVMPEMVQPGNEIIGGMLWPDGKVPDRWDQLADLLKAAVEGIQAGAGDAPRPLIMIHIDRGGDRDSTKWFFDNLIERDVPFDVIGQSFYPWWHGSMADLEANLAFMANTYHKPILIVEAAYCWRPTEYRDDPSKAPFPESPEGQLAFWQALDSAVRATPNGLGRGIFWWEPAVPPGPLRSRGMFSDDGEALPILNAFPPEPAAVTGRP